MAPLTWHLTPLLLVPLLMCGSVQSPGPKLLFEETFEDIDLKSRGWYDLADGTLASFTTREHAPHSTRSLEAHFRRGATTPVPKVAARRLFPESESVYVRYWVKYSDSWVGSGKPYHPHEFLLLTNADDPYVGPSRTHLTAYVEHNYQNGGVAVLGIQDGENIDARRVGADLGYLTEKRAVAGCNGDSRTGRGDCYQADGRPNNGRFWKSTRPVLIRASRVRAREGWHLVEAYFKLNSIRKGVGQDDGVAQYWLDGELLIDRHDVLFRTGAFPRMKFRQFMFAPFIGDGSPVDQTAWYDDFVVMTARPRDAGEEGRGKREE